MGYGKQDCRGYRRGTEPDRLETVDTYNYVPYREMAGKADECADLIKLDLGDIIHHL